MMTNVFVTMVLPAPLGCNLKCPFCAIAQRGEAAVGELQHDEYLEFLTGAASYLPVRRFSIQGYEPLLPEIFPLTRKLLQEADRFDLETRLVTNGTFLEQCAEELSGLVDMVTISLDSNEARVHEKLRGVPGCFPPIVTGIRAALSHFGPEGVIVGSIVFPKRIKYLLGMPAFLKELGVTEWTLAPLKDLSSFEDTYMEDNASLKETLVTLSEEANRFGITVSLADELRRLDVGTFYQGLSVATLEADDYVVRLSPDRTCSRGRECLRPSSRSPRWDGKEAPHSFLRRILAEVNVKV